MSQKKKGARRARPTASKSAPRVLPDDVYDTLHFSALAFGGIGAGSRSYRGDVPVCVYGHAGFIDEGTPQGGGVCLEAVRWAGIGAGPFSLFDANNDDAVRTINERKGIVGLAANSRVSFEDWCAELNVVPARAVAATSAASEAPNV